MFNLIEDFREICDKQGILFINGGAEWQNKLTTMKGLQPDQNVLGIECSVTPSFYASQITNVTYTLTIVYGRKVEKAGTKSSMQETFDAKWKARLHDLMEQLSLLMSAITCEYGYEISSFTMTPQINVTDLNIDVISAQATIIEEP